MPRVGTLRLACYDILELNGKEFKPDNYGEVLEELDKLLKGGKLVHPVDWEVAKDNTEVKKLFAQCMEKEALEGAVSSSDPNRRRMRET